MSCREGLVKQDRHTFPLCRICFTSLIPCPTLCSNCGSPLCLRNAEKICFRPWVQCPEIHSYSARYLLFERCFEVLKKWKIRGGVLFDQAILKSNDSLILIWKEFKADAVVPIPQRYIRAWKMRGSRAEKIAFWISCQMKIPTLSLLQFPVSIRNKKRQAELSLEERFKNQIEFLIDSKSLPRGGRLILVDDFMTSGRTLRLAARSLRNSGVSSIHVFALGVKIFRVN